MTDINALKLLNMFTEAAQIAKAENKYKYHLEMDETTLIELLKQAYPSLVDSANLKSFAQSILRDSI